MCAVSKPSFHLWTHPQGSPQIKDKRMEPCLRIEARLCHMPSPLAFSLVLLLPAKAPCFSLDPLFVTLAMGGIPPLCIPLVYSLYHPSINDPFTEAAEWGLSRACSSFRGMQLSCLHISRDLETCALTEPLSCVFSRLTGITITKKLRKASPMPSHRSLRRRMAYS